MILGYALLSLGCGLGAVWFALRADTLMPLLRPMKRSHVPKTQGMMIDLEHTENAGTVTLTLDRGGAATVHSTASVMSGTGSAPDYLQRGGKVENPF